MWTSSRPLVGQRGQVTGEGGAGQTDLVSLDGLGEQSHRPDRVLLFWDYSVRENICVSHSCYDVSITVSQSYVRDNTVGRRAVSGIDALASWTPVVCKGSPQLRVDPTGPRQPPR